MNSDDFFDCQKFFLEFKRKIQFRFEGKKKQKCIYIDSFSDFSVNSMNFHDLNE